MGNSWEAQMAVKQRADCARDAGHEVGEECDDPEAVAMEEWAECMVARGVDRRVALRCAAEIWEWQRARDRECAGGVLAWAGPVSGAAGREWLRAMAIRLVQAPKPRFSAGCFLHALGFTDSPAGGSIREWCSMQHVSAELGSNEVEEWQRMGLPRTGGQKSDAARASYQITNGRINDES